MPPFLADTPGRVYLLVTGLPLLAFAVLLLAGAARRLRGRNEPGAADRLAAYFATGCLVVSAGLAIVGLSWFFRDVEQYDAMPATMEARWAERADWVRIGGLRADAGKPGMVLELGYRIDRLTALTVAMVAVVGSLIFVFSLGYMREELGRVSDHVAHAERRGRYGRFFLYLSLFAFAMLNLLISDNLFQVFVSWELVGVASYFLIGFYTERTSAGAAATKAFVMNRIGDAGFLVGLAVAFAHFGTLNIVDLGRVTDGSTGLMVAAGSTAPEWVWTLFGLGLFCGAVGKSAQVPLHTWLPDAMEGPTPVSALIHAATMVAAGVYLVGRCFPLFTPTVLLVIAYTGAVTLFLSAAIALVQTDIKRVLAFSTGSQLGYMMLALGLGAWTAGLFHLLTHAFFKALLFLAAGSVIHGLHHEQDLRKMGGLRRKMPVTAYTMLVGVCAIVGVPLFSGWYSKDLILAHVIGTAGHDSAHPLLFVLPLLTVALTGYYMTRLWLLAFAGEPRDHHLADHAHESPPVMTGPLVVLAVFSVAVAWGWPVWDADASLLGDVIRAGEPRTSDAVLGTARHAAHEAHTRALIVGLVGAGLGVVAAFARFKAGTLADPGPPGYLRRAMLNRFYFDALYDALFTRPVLFLAALSGAADKRQNDHPAADAKRFDPFTLDGLITGAAQATAAAGVGLRPVQSGRLRRYVLALGLTLAAALGILVGLTR